MARGSFQDSWTEALLSGDVSACEALLTLASDALDERALEALQARTLEVFVEHALERGPLLEPMVALHSVLLRRNLLVREQMHEATDSYEGRSWRVLPFGDTATEWRRTALRVMIGRTREPEQWRALARDIANALRNVGTDVEVSSAPSLVLEKTRAVLDAHEIEDVFLNVREEERFRSYVLRSLPGAFGGTARGAPSAAANETEPAPGTRVPSDVTSGRVSRDPPEGDTQKQSLRDVSTDGRTPGARYRPEHNETGRAPAEQPTIGSAESAGSAPADADWLVKRTPHMTVPSQRLSPGAEFAVEIYADDLEPATGELSEPMSLRFPHDVDVISVDTWLSCSSHFEILGSRTGVLRIRRDEGRSENTVTFKLRVRGPEDSGSAGSAGSASSAGAVDAASGSNTDHASAQPAVRYEGAPPRITALFSFQGAPAGKVSRVLELEQPSQGDGSHATSAHPETVGGARPESRPMLLAQSRRRPDLEVQIVRHPDGQPWKYHCRVSGPNTLETLAVWNLPGQLDSHRFVEKRLSLFCSNQIGNQQRRDALCGAGEELFEAAPENFKTAYWRLVDENRPIESIAIYSEEPSIPWELMVPTRRRRDGSKEKHPALGAKAAVGRWIHADALPPPQHCKLADTYVIAPDYPVPLRHSDAEVSLVLSLFDGTEITPATYERIMKALGERRVSLLHFVCHGRSDEDGQCITLADNERLYAIAARGAEEFNHAFDAAPFVFLNACETGRQQPALVSPQGFAPVFINLGASAVIAAVWSIEDDVALEVARTLYESICTGRNRSPAAILRELRARSYAPNGKDSYAAYCFYGDPLLLCDTPEPPPSGKSPNTELSSSA